MTVIQGKVEICGVNTARLPVLKSAETRALLERARGGDKTAREELISGNLRLVLSVIQKFAGRGESMDDLFQVGCIGLIKAVDCFDLSQNVQFSTYGVPMIAGELRRFLRDHSAIRVSRSMRDTAMLLPGTSRKPMSTRSCTAIMTQREAKSAPSFDLSSFEASDGDMMNAAMLPSEIISPSSELLYPRPWRKTAA